MATRECGRAGTGPITYSVVFLYWPTLSNYCHYGSHFEMKVVIITETRHTDFQAINVISFILKRKSLVGRSDTRSTDFFRL